ncbi:hypothetical protein E9993_23320 [Labilibacter sediminis]|nr:hypothetical protein E9993_23320 [Labilibacter sediminis]
MYTNKSQENDIAYNEISLSPLYIILASSPMANRETNLVNVTVIGTYVTSHVHTPTPPPGTIRASAAQRTKRISTQAATGITGQNHYEHDHI